MRRIFVLAAIVLAAFWLAYIAQKYATGDTIFTLNATPVEETQPVPSVSDISQEEQLYGFISFASEHVLNIDAVLQMPDYPTGCETISLSMALNYITGERIAIDTIIDDYLPIDEHDFTEGFTGDPRSANGGGCFPTAIVKCANAFLNDNHIALTAADASGITLDEIFETIDAGFPVLMWTTMYLEEPQLTSHVVHRNGNTYQWYISEHCVLIKGYNQKKDTFIVNDPLVGEVEYDIETFMNISDIIGNLAVIIQ